MRASFLKSLGFRQAARKQKSVFSFKPNLPAFNSFAASGFRRLSLGGSSRRGSLEPLESNGTPNVQDVSVNSSKMTLNIGFILILAERHTKQIWFSTSYCR